VRVAYIPSLQGPQLLHRRACGRHWFPPLIPAQPPFAFQTRTLLVPALSVFRSTVSRPQISSSSTSLWSGEVVCDGNAHIYHRLILISVRISLCIRLRICGVWFTIRFPVLAGAIKINRRGVKFPLWHSLRYFIVFLLAYFFSAIFFSFLSPMKCGCADCLDSRIEKELSTGISDTHRERCES